MKVGEKPLELPEAIADSPSELARILGVTANSINSGISHAKASAKNSQYICVEIDEEVEE